MQSRNLIKAMMYGASIAWFTYLIVSSFGTDCFDMLTVYITVIVVILNMIINDLMK